MRTTLCVIVGLLILAVGAASVHAESLPTYPLDVLADKADVVVVAEPVETHPSGKGLWSKGWTAWDSVFEAYVPTKDLAPGRWRVRLEGFAGGARKPWRTRNHAFVWPPR